MRSLGDRSRRAAAPLGLTVALVLAASPAAASWQRLSGVSQGSLTSASLAAPTISASCTHSLVLLSIHVAWSGPTFPKSPLTYDLEQDGSIIQTSTATSYDRTDVLASSHTYRVRATYGSWIGSWSSSVTVSSLLLCP